MRELYWFSAIKNVPAQKAAHRLARILPDVVFAVGLSFSLYSSQSWSEATIQQPIVIAGWVETVSVPSEGLSLEAKLDTGADNASLHATQLTYVERNHQTWVRFLTVNGHWIERPLFKMISIKTKRANSLDSSSSLGSRPQERAVILLDVCLAGEIYTVPVNLSNRQNFSTPMLIGRAAMPAHFLVNPHQTHLTGSSCQIR